MHFKALADGVKPFKETEKGRETMCEAVEEYAREYGKECADERELSIKLNFIKKLMKEAGYTLEQALNMSDVNNDQRDYIISQLQK